MKTEITDTLPTYTKNDRYVGDMELKTVAGQHMITLSRGSRSFTVSRKYLLRALERMSAVAEAAQVATDKT